MKKLKPIALLKNMKKLLKIPTLHQKSVWMLIATLSLVSLSCGKQAAVLHVYNVKGQYFNRFEANMDPKKCEVTTKDLPPINADDVSLDGGVMVDRKTYSRLLASAKTDCINTQVTEQEIESLK